MPRGKAKRKARTPVVQKPKRRFLVTFKDGSEPAHVEADRYTRFSEYVQFWVDGCLQCVALFETGTVEDIEEIDAGEA
jgi:hypothetical protein